MNAKGWFSVVGTSVAAAIVSYGLATLVERKRRRQRGLRLIIFGAPASGKGTQSVRLVEEFGVTHISTGDLLRAEVAAGTSLGATAKGFMDRGELVPDDLCIAILQRAVSDAGPGGWLIDGMPRTANQAAAMTRLGLKPDALIVLDVPEQVLKARVTGRRLDPATGTIYHLQHKPPPTEEIARRLTQRSDDTVEKLQRRLGAYRANTDAVTGFYASRGLLHRIDGEKEGVFERLLVAVLRARLSGSGM